MSGKDGYLFKLFDRLNMATAIMLEGRGRSAKWFAKRREERRRLREAIDARRPLSTTPLSHRFIQL